MAKEEGNLRSSSWTQIRQSILGKIGKILDDGQQNTREVDNLCGLFTVEQLRFINEAVKRTSKKDRKQTASEQLRIERDVLDDMERLSSKGGSRARKSSGRSRNLTNEESKFLDSSLKRIIRRVAERSFSCKEVLDWIRRSNFPA